MRSEGTSIEYQLNSEELAAINGVLHTIRYFPQSPQSSWLIANQALEANPQSELLARKYFQGQSYILNDLVKIKPDAQYCAQVVNSYHKAYKVPLRVELGARGGGEIFLASPEQALKMTMRFAVNALNNIIHTATNLTSDYDIHLLTNDVIFSVNNESLIQPGSEYLDRIIISLKKASIFDQVSQYVYQRATDVIAQREQHMQRLASKMDKTSVKVSDYFKEED